VPVAPAHPTRRFSQKPVVLFLKGPVPLPWLAMAQHAGGTALCVGIFLWHLKGLTGTPENLVITRKRAKDTMGLGRDALSRGLDRLEVAKLIATTRGRGKAIRVTILPASPTESDRTAFTHAGMPPQGL
jgi:hypothetical protein